MIRNEGLDSAQSIDWVGEQPWCDGNVGLLRMSYLGTIQWLAASSEPKHLKAIIPGRPRTTTCG